MFIIICNKKPDITEQEEEIILYFHFVSKYINQVETV